MTDLSDDYKIYVSNWIFTPIKGNHTGIKLVRNWESDPKKEPKPCMRCYMSFGFCKWCMFVDAPRTFCSWEQFVINANWKYFPQKKCPKNAEDFYNLTWKFPSYDPIKTYDIIIKNIPVNTLSFMLSKRKVHMCEKDHKEYTKSMKQNFYYDRNWETKEKNLIPVPKNKQSFISNISSNIWKILK